MWLNRILFHHSSFTIGRSSASVLMVYMPEDKRLTLLRAGEGREVGREEAEKEREDH